MPNCCVYKCSNRGGHVFPKDLKLKKVWLNAVRRKNWAPTSTSIVCHGHFLASDYIQESRSAGYTLIRKRLKPNSVPTVFSWQNEKPKTLRDERKLEREKKFTFNQPEKNRNETGDVVHHTFDVAHEEIVDLDAPHANLPVHNFSSVADVASQTVTEGPTFSISAFTHNSRAIHFYTGLENYSKFSFVLQTLGPAAYQLRYYGSQVLHMSIENQFFLTLIKLRLNKQIFELSLMFDVSECTISNIFKTWIHFMALQWSEIDVWPSKDLVHYYMPKDFKRKFPQTRVIMDGTEFPICKPKDPNFQQVTFSTYKNRNTLKVLVGVTPGGLISYCSEAYGGSASDRQIVERSRFLNMCTRGDDIMADRGFNVQDLFAPKDIVINIPSFLKGKSQLPGITVVHDRKIASKRVHVERIIGLAKTYKILKQELNTNFVPLGSQLFSVCAMLCNFREGIVGKNA